MQSHSTTILAVRRQGQVAIGGDGQVTLGNVVMKSDAHKIRKLHNGKVLTGFAGASADAFALLERLAVDKHGGTLFAAFKTNATGAVGGTYENMFYYFRLRRSCSACCWSADRPAPRG